MNFPVQSPIFQPSLPGNEPRCPFTIHSQLYQDFGLPAFNGLPASLAGHPLVRLDDPISLGSFLENEYVCEDLAKMAPHLWLMSTHSNSSIRPLHRQRVLGRRILITESPRLHLVWYYDQIYIKPLPAYLLSHAFWQVYLLSKDSPLGNRRHAIRKAALGYIRTYRYLIRYPSDFEIAQESSARLVPVGITWHQFCAFVSEFDTIDDKDVVERYEYGELRMTRLNFYSKFLLRRSQFDYLPAQYATYFNRYFGPILFTFAAASLELSAMQVEVAVGDTLEASLFSVLPVYRWFSISVILGGIVILVMLLGRALYMYTNEWVFALGARRKWLREKRKDAANSI